MSGETNSKVTRVEPVFGWLRDNGEPEWPSRLLELADGISARATGALQQIEFEQERVVPASATRLAWMLRNSDRLAPQDGKLWRRLVRAGQHTEREAILAQLDKGNVTGIWSKVARELKLEGDTKADCLLTCEKGIIWIEGKRNDWLSPGTAWDVSRDQLARNIEAVWHLARQSSKDYWLLICHERQLKHHEQCLIEGYRTGTWTGGLPHLSAEDRRDFRTRIGTVQWQQIANAWPDIRKLPALRDLA